MSDPNTSADPAKPARYQQVKKKQASASGTGAASGGAAKVKEIVVHAVDEVYIYIPAELSAAGFEIKIAGSVRIVDKVSLLAGINWNSLY